MYLDISDAIKGAVQWAALFNIIPLVPLSLRSMALLCCMSVLGGEVHSPSAKFSSLYVHQPYGRSAVHR